MQRPSSSPQPSSTAQKMHLSLFTLIALIALTAVRATVPASKPSGVPSCTYTCPPTDELGFQLGVNGNDGTTLFCSYPAVQGEDSKDFFCEYSSTDGAQTQDHDAGLCPSSAVESCSGTRRRDTLPQPPAPPVALPPVSAPNDKMKVRTQSKKRQARIPSSSTS